MFLYVMYDYNHFRVYMNEMIVFPVVMPIVRTRTNIYSNIITSHVDHNNNHYCIAGEKKNSSKMQALEST